MTRGIAESRAKGSCNSPLRAERNFDTERCPKYWILFVIAASLGFIAASVYIQKGGWLHGEADWFLVDHNDPDRSFISKVICPHRHDANQYQARELSHLLEHIDARFIYWCTTRGMPHFYSVMNFVILFAIAVMHWRLATKHLGMHHMTATLLVALFWTAPCIFFSGLFVRTAKQGTALMLFLLVWHVLRQFLRAAPATNGEQNISKLNTRSIASPVLTFILALSLCFMDRQGFYLLAGVAVTLVVFRLAKPFPRGSAFIWPIIGALIVHTAYNLYIGPRIIPPLTGYEVSFEYQRLPMDKLLERPFFYVWHGLTLALNTFRHCFGNVSAGLALALWAGLFWVFRRARTQTNCANSQTSGVLAPVGPFSATLVPLWIGLTILLNALMVLRHEPLIWPDHATLYYWIPATVVVLFALTFGSHLLATRLGVSRRILNMGLAVVLLSNLTSLREHYIVAHTGHFRGLMAGGPHLLRALKEVAQAPIGNFPLGKPLDTKAVARMTEIQYTIKNPLAFASLSVEEFVSSSHFYNFMRSRRNLPFVQLPEKTPEVAQR
jgi:hypothetical protein